MLYSIVILYFGLIVAVIVMQIKGLRDFQRRIAIDSTEFDYNHVSVMKSLSSFVAVQYFVPQPRKWIDILMRRERVSLYMQTIQYDITGEPVSTRICRYCVSIPDQDYFYLKLKDAVETNNLLAAKEAFDKYAPDWYDRVPRV